MILVSSYEIAKEQQRDERREAEERASKGANGEVDGARSGVRHLVAGTLRRMADTLEPIT